MLAVCGGRVQLLDELLTESGHITEGDDMALKLKKVEYFIMAHITKAIGDGDVLFHKHSGLKGAINSFVGTNSNKVIIEVSSLEMNFNLAKLRGMLRPVNPIINGTQTNVFVPVNGPMSIVLRANSQNNATFEEVKEFTEDWASKRNQNKDAIKLDHQEHQVWSG